MTQAGTPGATAPPGTADEAARALEGDFPGWRVWRSSAGRWWATRTGAGAPGKCRDGDLPMTVDADSEGQLRAVLAADGQA
jgi:hypothetical protein